MNKLENLIEKYITEAAEPLSTEDFKTTVFYMSYSPRVELCVKYNEDQIIAIFANIPGLEKPDHVEKVYFAKSSPQYQTAKCLFEQRQREGK